MRSETTLNEINSYLALLRLEIEGRQANSLYDLNRHCQRLLTEILSVVYDLPDLRNLDQTDASNFPAIDLASDMRGTAIQVTSDTSAAKVNHTVDVFLKQGLEVRYSSLRIVLLTGKRPSYRSATSIVTGKFRFHPPKDVIAFDAISRDISALSLARINQVHAILEREYGPTGLGPMVVSERELTELTQVFVQPSGFSEAAIVLDQTGFVMISGPPHVGKTSTALALLAQSARIAGHSRIVRCSGDEYANLPMTVEGEFILIDDVLGKLRFELPDVANSFDALMRLARRNRIVVTSRAQALAQALAGQTRLAERADLKSHMLILSQEGSYDDSQLAEVLQNHLNARLREDPSLGHAVDFAASLTGHIIQELRFPHNLERLTQKISSETKDLATLRASIAGSKDIVNAARSWFLNLEASSRAWVTALALLPREGIPVLTAVVQRHCRARNLHAPSPESVAKVSGGFLTVGGVVRLAHPSYWEGVVGGIRESHRGEALELLNEALLMIQPRSFADTCPFLVAADKVEGTFAHEDLFRIAEPWPFEEYFHRFLAAYETFLDRDFPALRNLFDPVGPERVRVHVYLGESGLTSAWSFMSRAEGEPAVTSSASAPGIGVGRLTPEEVEERGRGFGYSSVTHFGGPDRRSLPEVDAARRVYEQIRNALPGAKTALGDLASRAYLWGGLANAGFPLDEVSDARPLSAVWVQEWADAFFDALESGTWPTELPQPRQRLNVFLTDQIINGLSIPWACETLGKMSDRGANISGPVLVPRDLDWSEKAYRFAVSAHVDVYSNARLVEAVTIGVATHFVALKESLEEALPTLKEQLWLYRQYPFAIDCVVDRDREDFMERPWILMGLRNAEPFSQDEPISVRVHLIDPDTAAERRRELQEMSRAFTRRDSEYFSWGGFDFLDCIDTERWISNLNREMTRHIESFLEGLEYRLFKHL